PESLLVREPRDAHDHRVLIGASGEKRQRRRLSAELVLGVVQVGEILDLGDWQEPELARPEREAQDRLFVEERVEDTKGAEAVVEPLRHAIDAALLGHVLAEDERRRMLLEDFAERALDALSERERPVASWGARGDARTRRVVPLPVGVQRREHGAATREARPLLGALCLGVHALGGALVEREQLGGRRTAGLEERARVPEHRIRRER